MGAYRPIIVGVTLGILSTIFGNGLTFSADVPIVIENGPDLQIADGVTVPVIGIRPLGNSDLNAWNVKGDFSISAEAIRQSAWYTTDIKSRLGLEDINSANIEDIIRFMRENYSVENIASAGYADVSGVYIQAPQDSFMNVAEESGGYLNASAITRMVVAGAIDVSKPETVLVGGKSVEYFNVNEEYAKEIKSIYTEVDSMKSTSYLEAGWDGQNVIEKVSGNHVLASALAFGLGDITFGRPIVMPASEMNLVIPQSVSKDWDVYWVDFAVTYRDLQVSYLEEIGFNVDLPQHHTALKLIPIRVGLDMIESEKLNSPEIGVEVKGVKLSLGEFYSRNVEYSYVRPTVIGFGLQEPSFSWSLTEEAITSGAQRFSAIIGVPKGGTQLTIRVSGKVETKDTMWGSGTIAGTSPTDFTYNLQ